MSYRVVLTRAASRDLRRLFQDILSRVTQRLPELEGSPYPRGTVKLSGGYGYRLRVGDFRILYTVDEDNQTVTVIAIRHRREAYRGS